MPTVIQNRWDGGHAEDIRTFATNQSEYSLNFDIFTNPHYLLPHLDTVAESVTGFTITDHKMSDVIDDASVSSDGYIALGQAGVSDTNLKFFSKSEVTGAWTKRAEQSANTVISNTLVGYKGLAFALETQVISSVTGINLVELTNTSTITDRGHITAETVACKPFVHPKDNLLYIGAGDQIARYDGTNDIDSATGSSAIITALMPTGSVITSFTSYGDYLAIACNNNGGKAIAYLWGRDSTVTTFQQSIDFGRGSLNVLENIGEVLVGVVYETTATSLNSKIFIKIWAGGEVRTLKEISVTYSGPANPIFKAKVKDKLYFITGNADCIYVVGKNKNGEWFISKDRYMSNSTTPNSVKGLSVIGDYMWIGYNDGSNSVFFLSTNPNYTDTSTYRTTINSNMPIVDRYRHKQLEAVQISFTGVASGTIQVKYSVDGSTMSALIPSGSGGTTTTAIEDVREMTNEDGGEALLSGREFQFQIECTGGVKIKELKYKYQVLPTTI